MEGYSSENLHVARSYAPYINPYVNLHAWKYVGWCQTLWRLKQRCHHIPLALGSTNFLHTLCLPFLESLNPL